MIRKGLVYITFFLLSVNTYASYEEGKKVFENKCASCHGNYISIKNLKVNFFEKDNKLYNITVPTVNMLSYAIMDSSKKIGDPEDPEMRQMEIEEYLKGYLENPDITQTICDESLIKYYDKKKPIVISDEEAVNLAQFFMQYTNKRLEEFPEPIKILDNGYDENKLILQAKKENKKLIIYATSKTCYFCKKMDREVLSLEDVQKRMNKNFIFVEIDVDEINLPFGLNEHFKKITPTFFFVDTNKKLLNSYPGSWIKKDWLTILGENEDEK